MRSIQGGADCRLYLIDAETKTQSAHDIPDRGPGRKPLAPPLLSILKSKAILENTCSMIYSTETQLKKKKKAYPADILVIGCIFN